MYIGNHLPGFLCLRHKKHLNQFHPLEFWKDTISLIGEQTNSSSPGLCFALNRRKWVSCNSHYSENVWYVLCPERVLLPACELAKWSIRCEASLFPQHRPPWIVAYHSDMYSACFRCRVRTGLVSGMPFKTNAVHSRSLQMCRPQHQGSEMHRNRRTLCGMNILKDRTPSQSRSPSGLKVTWPKALAGLKRIPDIPANILPQCKACVGDLPSPPCYPSSAFRPTAASMTQISRSALR